MFEDLKADLRRYVKVRGDCCSSGAYFLQFVPVVLFHEGAMCMIGYRLSAWFTRHGLRSIAYIISKIFLFLTGNYIHHMTAIAPGCKINHSGVVIRAERIGKGFEGSANITIGQKIPYRSAFPVIGDYVMVGTGARVLADVGDEVIIGANSVVIEPAESGSTVVGIPARNVGTSKAYMEYYKSFFVVNHASDWE